MRTTVLWTYKFIRCLWGPCISSVPFNTATLESTWKQGDHRYVCDHCCLITHLVTRNVQCNELSGLNRTTKETAAFKLYVWKFTPLYLCVIHPCTIYTVFEHKTICLNVTLFSCILHVVFWWFLVPSLDLYCFTLEVWGCVHLLASQLLSQDFYDLVKLKLLLSLLVLISLFPLLLRNIYRLC